MTIVQHNNMVTFARQLAQLACSDLNILPEITSSATMPATRPRPRATGTLVQRITGMEVARLREVEACTTWVSLSLHRCSCASIPAVYPHALDQVEG